MKRAKKTTKKKSPVVTSAAVGPLEYVSYDILNEPLLKPELPAEVARQHDELHELVFDDPHAAIDRLKPLIEAYPQVPELKNWLAKAYSDTGQDDLTDSIQERLWNEHPDYLFARVGRAHWLIRNNRADEVPSAFDGKYDLQKLYPDRTAFHVSEAVAFFSVYAIWGFRTGDVRAAEMYSEIVESIAPDHPILDRLEYEMLLAAQALVERAIRELPPATRRKRTKKSPPKR